MKQISYSDIRLGGFWKKRFEINRDVTIPNVYDRFDETGRIKAFRCDWKEGMPDKPHIFWDSDVAKWMEAAAYTIAIEPDEELEKKIEDIIDLIEKNQHEDGYFNIYYTVVEPGNRFTKRDNHELYCAGHLTEAAVAYYEATGKDRFLKLMCRYMDCIEKNFITEKTAKFSTPGHEEIELALIRLYKCTGNGKYLEMCRHFVEMRGRCEDDLNCRDWCDESYDQSDKPIRELPHVFGHSVRALYYLSGAADLARETGDEELFNTCDRLFRNVAEKRMYITGGVGSSHKGEALTADYDLPNDMAYSETCASIALAFFARRMSLMHPDARYDDVAELAIYNCALAGVSLDGRSFFYVNPLEINREKHSVMEKYHDYKMWLLTKRVEVFGCSCCPPNIARLIPSIGEFIYSSDDTTVYVHHYIDSEAEFDGIKIKQMTRFPNQGDVRFTVSGMKGRKFAVRIPGWASYVSLNGRKYTDVAENGYAYIDITEDEQVLDFYFEMNVKFISANPLVDADHGKVCVKRGPLVYCFESVPNDDIIPGTVSLDLSSTPGLVKDEKSGVYNIVMNAFVDNPTDKLYREFDPSDRTEKEIVLQPYFTFANNEAESDMLLWLRYC